jgi:hypothetical protein
MTSRKRKLLDDQIEAEVIADLDDPSAWEEPIFVPPSKSRTELDAERSAENVGEPLQPDPS